MNKLHYFKNYDIRGKIDQDLTVNIIEKIARGYAQVFIPELMVIGHDIRPTSARFAQALAEGFMAEGVDVIHIGLCGAEEVYFATDHFKTHGGMMVTASHNPIEYNGIKIVGRGCVPIAAANGLDAVEQIVREESFSPFQGARGSMRHENCRDEYARRVASFLGDTLITDTHLVVNSCNGVAGPAFDAVLAALESRGCRIKVERVHHEPDGTFPNGIPNPMLVQNQPQTSQAVLSAGADLGVAWDGDFDRCFFFDGSGNFIEGEYMVALLGATFLDADNVKIVHDPRVVWAVQDTVSKGGGTAHMSPVGHSNIKRIMREIDAVYGGEMAAHHYFRDFMYCDSGMIPLVLVLKLIQQTGQSLSQLVTDIRQRFPSSGERNFEIENKDDAMALVETEFGQDAKVDRTDGLSLDFDTWRLNIRKSNTEPILRLNLESRNDRALLGQKIKLIEQTLKRTV